MRQFIHNVMIGAGTLAILTIAFQGGAVESRMIVTEADILEELAIILDDHNDAPQPPDLPCRKVKNWASCEIDELLAKL